MADRDLLPDNVKPIHYRVSLFSLDFMDWTYRGTVIIDVQIVKCTSQITLNSFQLRLSHAKIVLDQTKPPRDIESTTFTYDEPAQRVTIIFNQELPVSQMAAISIEFEGVINNEMAGFYRSKYKPAVTPVKSVPHRDAWYYMLSTQFEPCDARRAFPCFDEPNLKASFDFEIEVPVDQSALSNMPVKNTRLTKDGWNRVRFETTPVMSTYLLAWAVGDFEYVQAHTDRFYNGRQLPVRVYTTRGLKDQGHWALQHATRFIDFFSEIFDLDYPLPKADLLAVHEFSHGATENWGLSAYRTTQLLFDERSSDSRYRRSVAYVVAHELAHQWFGNLVTMDWWDELWLNEGFATWIGWYAVDYLHPEWQVWVQFINQGLDSAFHLDGIRASHPIHVPIRDALDIHQVFDSISYLKGCALIRMLASHLGVGTFLKGVSTYLRTHAYTNAKTEALWTALTQASGEDVHTLMGPWISNVGYPVLSVAEVADTISLKQSRFLSTGDVRSDDDTTIWWVPLALRRQTAQCDVAGLSLTQKDDTIHKIDDEFYILNSGAIGFYRVNYPPSRLASFSTQLDKLSIEDKIFIIGSAADLAFSGEGTTAALLTFLEGFGDERHPLVWTQILDSLSRVKAIFSDDEEIKRGLESYVLRLIDKRVNEIGWEFVEGEDYLIGILRRELINIAAASGHSSVVNEANKRFKLWAQDPVANPIHPSLRIPIWCNAIRQDPVRAVEILKEEWFMTNSIDGKPICLQALSVTEDEDLLRESIVPFNFNSTPDHAVPAADMRILGIGLAANPVGRVVQWEYMKQNWDACLSKMGNPIIVDRFIRVSLAGFTDECVLDDIGSFFKDQDTRCFNRTLATVNDHIRGRATYRKRDSAPIKDWLGVNGYL
ncbi:Aminopeptidase [Penicillium digitatum]|uniref:Aminopeptidase n=1 Tax=Penicillium digitatum TaxID=36651 RepID=A0A7T7BQ38_PENDI|nr:Aminopeptidase [Penicillium digitatum]